MTHYIYIVHIPHDNAEWKFKNELYKIGMTSHLKNRLYRLRAQWNHKVEYIAFSPVKNVHETERKIHDKYKNYRFTESFSPWIGNLVEYFLFDENTLKDVILTIWNESYKPIETKETYNIYDEYLKLKEENKSLKCENLSLKEKILILENGNK